MKCPHCNHPDDHVIDSRPVENSNVIRRRRECMKCEKRFTTYERHEAIPLMVIKSDNRREPFSRVKLREGLSRAFIKRDISADQIEKCVGEIEVALQEDFVLEVPSRVVGNLVMEKLRGLDLVAYIRFASVYKKFSDIDAFLDELKALNRAAKKKREKAPPPARTVALPAYSQN